MLLLASSLSPLILGLAVQQFINAEYVWGAILTAFFLLFACACIFVFCKLPSHGERFTLHIRQFVRRSDQVSALLVAYVLPLLGTDTHWLMTAYFLLVLGFALYYGGIYHFNPVMAVLRYHYYTVETDSETNHLLISRVPLRPRMQSVSVVRFTPEVSVLAGDLHE